MGGLDASGPGRPRLHPPPEALPGHRLEIFAQGRALGRGEIRQEILLGGEIELAAGGDAEAVLEGLGRLRKEGAHLLAGLEVELVGREFQPVRVGDLLVRLDADEDVLALRVLPAGEVDVVRGDEREVEPSGQADEKRVDGLLVGDAVVLELDVEAVLPEDRSVLAGRVLGLLDEAPGEPGTELALEAGREPDEPLGVGREQLLVDPRAVVEALEIALRQEPAEVPVALPVPDEEDEMEMVDVVRRPGLLVEAAARRDVDLAAEDGLDAAGLGLLEKLDGAEDVAVVGDGHGRHVVPDGRLDQVRHLQGAVEDAVLGMVVEVNERRFHRSLSPKGGAAPCGPPAIPTRSSRAAWS